MGPEERFAPIHHYGSEFGQEKYLKGKDGLQVVDVLESFELNNHRAHAVEYLLRAGKKGDQKLTDLRKAIWWVKREIALDEHVGRIAQRFPPPCPDLDGDISGADPAICTTCYQAKCTCG